MYNSGLLSAVMSHCKEGFLRCNVYLCLLLILSTWKPAVCDASKAGFPEKICK